MSDMNRERDVISIALLSRVIVLSGVLLAGSLIPHYDTSTRLVHGVYLESHGEDDGLNRYVFPVWMLEIKELRRS
jgi:hypothetical protein